MVLTVQEKLGRIAKLVVERNLNVKKGEQVVIQTWAHTLDAADEFYYAVRKRGGNPGMLFNVEDAYFKALKDLNMNLLMAKNEFARAIAGVENVNIFFAGPSDPRKFMTVSYEKINATQDNKLQAEITKVQKQRKVRSAFVNIGQATPERAAAYGIEYEKWRDAMLDALMADPDEMARIAKPLITAIKKGKHGVLRSSDGSALKFRLAGRSPVLDDGVLRPEDIKRGDNFVHLPAGVIFTAPLEASANGRIYHDIPQPSRGQYVKGVWADVKNGVLARYGAEKNEKELKEIVESQNPGKMELGYFTIGVNPAAQPYFIDHQMARGVVGFHFANNATFGGKIKDRQYYFTGFSKKATLEIDGKAIVMDGKLIGR